MLLNIYDSKFAKFHKADPEAMHKEARTLVRLGLLDENVNYCPWCEGPPAVLREGMPEPTGERKSYKPTRVDPLHE
jgi:hypothetical protein